MKIKRNIPYFLSATIIAVLLSFDAITLRNDGAQLSDLKEFKPKYTISAYKEAIYNIQKQEIEERAEQLITNYVDNAVNGAKRIIENKKKKGYVSAVHKELPGAPAHQHCLYGQYTQLNRALQQMGDTIQIIPKTNNAHMATSSFKHSMTKLYDNPEYPNSIHRGHLYVSETEYNRALNKYVTIKTRGQSDTVLQEKYTKEFEKNNYCASHLNPGTIIIVNSGHAIMYLGIGRIQNKEFIPDKKGQPICCAYNAEHTAMRLSDWEINRSFAADIQNIVTQKYLAQLKTKTK
jgi:hypothetical protein